MQCKPDLSRLVSGLGGNVKVGLRAKTFEHHQDVHLLIIICIVIIQMSIVQVSLLAYIFLILVD